MQIRIIMIPYVTLKNIITLIVYTYACSTEIYRSITSSSLAMSMKKIVK